MSNGARSFAEARQIAKTIADSPLVKTAIFGGDPNWGRIVSAAGYSGVSFDETELSLWLGDFLLYRGGVPEPFDRDSRTAYLKTNREVYLANDVRKRPGAGHFLVMRPGL